LFGERKDRDVLGPSTQQLDTLSSLPELGHCFSSRLRIDPVRPSLQPRAAVAVGKVFGLNGDGKPDITLQPTAAKPIGHRLTFSPPKFRRAAPSIRSAQLRRFPFELLFRVARISTTRYSDGRGLDRSASPWTKTFGLLLPVALEWRAATLRVIAAAEL
jgi:hypothetical protein